MPARRVPASALIARARVALSLFGGRSLFFDLGCTMWAGGREAWGMETGTGVGPSLPLFTRMYKERCVTFDEVFGWEMTPHSPSEWWRPVPKSMRSRLRFFNVGVDEGNMTQALVQRPWAKPAPHETVPTSFLRTLREEARVEDFVVVKLDIDGGPERQVVDIVRCPCSAACGCLPFLSSVSVGSCSKEIECNVPLNFQPHTSPNCI